MIDLQSLGMLCRRGDVTLIVLAKYDLDEKTVSMIRAYIGCPPWESIDTRILNGARLIVADVERSFALTHGPTIHML